MRSFITSFRKKILDFPDGIAWKLTDKITMELRRKKYNLFISHTKPKPEETILDVGVSAFFGRSTNFLELWYPYPEKITALSHDDPGEFAKFKELFPKIKLIFGDAKNLDFPDNSFDIVFSNAVVEHVGNRNEQRKLIQELIRVGKRTFITTPNYYFPLESHTLIPIVHYFPVTIRFWIYRKLGKGIWADFDYLNLLTPKQLLSLFPSKISVKLLKQRIFGIPYSLIALVEKSNITEDRRKD